MAVVRTCEPTIEERPQHFLLGEDFLFGRKSQGGKGKSLGVQTAKNQASRSRANLFLHDVCVWRQLFSRENFSARSTALSSPSVRLDSQSVLCTTSGELHVP